VLFPLSVQGGPILLSPSGCKASGDGCFVNNSYLERHFVCSVVDAVPCSNLFLNIGRLCVRWVDRRNTKTSLFQTYKLCCVFTDTSFVYYTLGSVQLAVRGEFKETRKGWPWLYAMYVIRKHSREYTVTVTGNVTSPVTAVTGSVTSPVTAVTGSVRYRSCYSSNRKCHCSYYRSNRKCYCSYYRNNRKCYCSYYRSSRKCSLPLLLQQ
jgi:hypothetical protein